MKPSIWSRFLFCTPRIRRSCLPPKSGQTIFYDTKKSLRRRGLSSPFQGGRKEGGGRSDHPPFPCPKSRIQVRKAPGSSSLRRRPRRGWMSTACGPRSGSAFSPPRGPLRRWLPSIVQPRLFPTKKVLSLGSEPPRKISTCEENGSFPGQLLFMRLLFAFGQKNRHSHESPNNQYAF